MRLLLALLLLVPVVAPAADEGDAIATPADDLSATPADSSRKDPYGDYLDFLSRFGERRFSRMSLEGVSLADSTVDSLVHHFDSTGVAPDPTPGRPPRLGVDTGIAGLRYNRVEGLGARASLGVRLPVRPRLTVGGWVGYETAPEEIDWEAAVRTGRIGLLGGSRVRVLHTRKVLSYGSGGIVGNTVTALVAGDDFDDYFRRKGWEIGIFRSISGIDLDLSFRIEDQESVPAATDFSLFGGDDPFRPNPAIDDGEARILMLEMDPSESFDRAILLRGEGAFAGSGLGGDFDYRSGAAEATGIVRPWLGDRAILRLAGAIVEGDSVPYQAAHHLGGFATLRGYGVNEFHADRFVHVGFDYEIGTNLLRPIPGLGGLRLQFVPFFDAAAFLPFRGPDEAEHRFAAGLGIQKNLFGIP
ncbi:MAG: hypothetical protein GF346_05890, partial [Candidatus Eisenbacteria bacterium]|nr:hypothetical protein [Candidatus Latescibacterota bacterium]MBD3301960.1 hypothetical protein [Candidatus Eisenbacteria bacterium]